MISVHYAGGIPLTGLYHPFFNFVPFLPFL